MKFSIVIISFVWSVSLFGQSDSGQQGHFFRVKPGEYFTNVIKPWKYQFIPAEPNNFTDSVKKIGKIIFWRTTAIYDKVSKSYWKPDISFDIYYDTDTAYIRNLADHIKMNSNCDSLNKGGDVLFIGHFMLLSSSSCVNCASLSNIDYCRKLVIRILNLVPDKTVEDWNAILDQFIIERSKFRS